MKNKLTAFLCLLFFITSVSTFVLPQFMVKEPKGVWTEAPAWKSGIFFGTYLGENIFFLVLRCAQISLQISFYSLAISFALAIILMFVNFHPLTANVYEKCVPIISYFPRLLFLICFCAIINMQNPSQLERSVVFYLILSFSITGGFFLAAQASLEISNLRQKLFVRFSHSLKIPSWRIFFRHILKNSHSLPLVTVKQFRDNILFLAILTFVGVVHLEPNDLGGLILKYYESPDVFYQGWWILFFPCAFLCWLILLLDLIVQLPSK